MISIITPAYNPERIKFIKLIESIKGQSDRDFEWVIVDDHSDLEVKDQYSEELNDERFHVYRSKTNSGVGEARNNGLKFCNGDYIVFIDCDDYVDNKLIEIINAAIKKHSPDIVFFDYYRVEVGKLNKCKTLFNIQMTDVEKNEAILASTTNVCGKVVRTDIIKKNNITFPKLKRYEDWVFMIHTMQVANKMYYVERPLYYYVDNANSAVHSSDGNSYDYANEAFNIISRFEIRDNNIVEALYIREVIYLVIKCNLKLSKNKLISIVEQYSSKFPKWQNNVFINQMESTKRLVIGLYRYKLFFALKVLSFFI